MSTRAALVMVGILALLATAGGADPEVGVALFVLIGLFILFS